MKICPVCDGQGRRRQFYKCRQCNGSGFVAEEAFETPRPDPREERDREERRTTPAPIAALFDDPEKVTPT